MRKGMLLQCVPLISSTDFGSIFWLLLSYKVYLYPIINTANNKECCCDAFNSWSSVQPMSCQPLDILCTEPKQSYRTPFCRPHLKAVHTVLFNVSSLEGWGGKLRAGPDDVDSVNLKSWWLERRFYDLGWTLGQGTRRGCSFLCLCGLCLHVRVTRQRDTQNWKTP